MWALVSSPRRRSQKTLASKTTSGLGKLHAVKALPIVPSGKGLGGSIPCRLPDRVQLIRGGIVVIASWCKLGDAECRNEERWNPQNRFVHCLAIVNVFLLWGRGHASSCIGYTHVGASDSDVCPGVPLHSSLRQQLIHASSVLLVHVPPLHATILWRHIRDPLLGLDLSTRNCRACSEGNSPLAANGSREDTDLPAKELV